jgi:hypothetical protein
MRVFYLLLSLSVLTASPLSVFSKAYGAQAGKPGASVVRGAPFGLVNERIQKPVHKKGFVRDIRNPGILRSAKHLKKLGKLKVTIIRGTAMKWFALQNKTLPVPAIALPVLLEVKHTDELIIKYAHIGIRHVEHSFQRYTGFKRQYSGPRYTGFRNDYFGPRYLEGSY